MIKPDGYESEIAALKERNGADKAHYESEVVRLNDHINDLLAVNKGLEKSGNDLFAYTCALERIVAQADELFDRAASERLFPSLSDPAIPYWAIDIARGAHMWQRSQIVDRARRSALNRNVSAGKLAALTFAEFAADVSALIGFVAGALQGTAPAAITAAVDRLIAAIDRTAGREPAGQGALLGRHRVPNETGFRG